MSGGRRPPASVLPALLASQIACGGAGARSPAPDPAPETEPGPNDPAAPLRRCMELSSLVSGVSMARSFDLAMTAYYAVIENLPACREAAPLALSDPFELDMMRISLDYLEIAATHVAAEALYGADDVEGACALLSAGDSLASAAVSEVDELRGAYADSHELRWIGDIGQAIGDEARFFGFSVATVCDVTTAPE